MLLRHFAVLQIIEAASFFNPGRLFGDLTVDKLKRDDYQSRARNKLIAEAFYLTRDIEKYGSGFIGYYSNRNVFFNWR
jgi:predicted HTH transcriptional regulator